MEPPDAAQGAPKARWTSLLQPGRAARRLDERDWFLLLFLYLVTLALRWDLRGSQPYLAESWHYFVALHLWASTSNVVLAPDGPLLDLSWFFWQRPLLALPFHPFALHSFEAYRAAHIVLVSAVPPLGAWLLRSLGTGRAATAAAAGILAVHPLLLAWGVLVLPDSLLLLLLLGAFLAAHHGRPALAAAALWAATWVKEVAVVGAVALAVLALWRDADGRRASLWPPRLGPFARWLVPVVPLALLPLAVSMHFPGALVPGFRAGGSTAEALERLFLLVWIAPVPLLGLLRPATRRFTLLAAVWPVFFLLYHLVLDKALESWYYVVPASLTLLAAAAGLDAWRSASPRPWARHALAGVGAVALALVLVQVTVPVDDRLNQAVTTPLTGQGQWDLPHLQAFEGVRDAGLAEVIALPGDDERATWIAMDFEVSYLYHPLAAQADLVVAVHSVPHPLPREAVEAWQQAIEHEADVTVIAERDTVDNLALRAAYAECSVRAWPYVLVRARDCQGAGDDLWERYEAAQAPPT